MSTNEQTLYEVREIGESDWRAATKAEYEHCQRDPHMDTRIVSNGHVLFTTADADRPDQICDRNGEVVLAQCRRCGKGEIELNEPCDAGITTTHTWPAWMTGAENDPEVAP